MTLAQITPVVLTLNEAPNVIRCLERLRWAAEVVVLDSFSIDGTPELAADYPHVRLSQRQFDDHAAQWSHAVSLATTPWVLTLDADYILGEGFEDELEALSPDDETSAYFARFEYCVSGRPLRASLYPPRAVLFRKDRCNYVNEGHTQVLSFSGNAEFLSSVIRHDDRKPFTSWLRAQRRYAALEARHLLSTPKVELNRADRLRRWIVAAPPLVFLYTLLAKRLILDGGPGWRYVMQRTLAETILSLQLIRAWIGRCVGWQENNPWTPSDS